LLSNLSAIIYLFFQNKIRTLPTDHHQHKPNLFSQIRHAIINRVATANFWLKG
jgi:single-stranded DNA-specific DHH superfamily exonuclease